MAWLTRWLERVLLFGGGALLAVWLLAFLHQHLLAAWDRAVFDRPLARREPEERSEEWFAPSVDTSEWSAGRIAAFRASLAPFDARRLALLEIPSIDLAVVVLDGSDEWTLNRGVGRIAGTAAPGTAGNVGIAGHRDGFFRGLGRLREGDVVRLRLPAARQASLYRVDWTRVVDPEDIWVLAATGQPSLTLVTCHPFRFVGHAPERYVVRAVAVPAPRVGLENGAITDAFPVLQSLRSPGVSGP